jgi:uncharacterized membrane protein
MCGDESSRYADSMANEPASRRDWLIPGSLILLAAVPIAVGTFRLGQLARGGPSTAATAHFFVNPLPVVLHILAATLFSILGALQFAPRLRRHRNGWHRIAGRIVVLPCGLLAAFSGLWMVQFFPPVNFDGPVLHVIRLVVGSAMALFLCLGFIAIRRRDVAAHRAWMIRGYALGLGAGTQVFTHLPFLMLPDALGEVTRALAMGAGWAINLAVAEWVIRRTESARAITRTASERRDRSAGGPRAAGSGWRVASSALDERRWRATSRS